LPESHRRSGKSEEPLSDYTAALVDLLTVMQPFLESLPEEAPPSEPLLELNKALPAFELDIANFAKGCTIYQAEWKTQKSINGELKKAVERLAPLAEMSRDLVKQSDLLFKLIGRVIESCEKECNAKESAAWVNRDVTRARKAADEARRLAVEQLKQVRYFWKQAHWLTERFPEAKLRDVAGLVKLVDVKEIEANDWSLTPGRYVGVAPEEVDEDFDFEETLREIHVELEDLNAEAATLAAAIKKNFEELGI
jgi:type I restriction enzyme M protein